MDQEQRLQSGAFISAEDSDENNLRPQFLKDFVGQSKLKENLSVFIQASKKRGDSLDHIFFSGPPGLGKTTLSGIIANELGVKFRSTSAPALEKQGDLAAILTTIGQNNVFFIDEIHRLRPAVEEILYTAMEDFEIDVIIGQGPGARTIKIPIQPFTLIGATTKAGMVSSPLYSRFGITNTLEFYSFEESEQIIHRSADILQAPVEKGAAEILAKCARGTPRVANRLLRRMRDFAQVWGDGRITKAIVAQGLEALEIDKEGLDRVDRKILEVIIQRYDGGPVGSETLAISISEAADTLEDVYEPYLIQKGFIKRTPRGRMVTSLAYKHLGIKGGPHEDQGLLF
ncbi:MAG: Holliday junction branch migration DNA helicase RuvB [Spirochaetales bacterium]|nr:Holliday junction branch migration DNA helicase RuvB [Spirochaetales bacterium]